MSGFFTQRAKQSDPLTEQLAHLKPEQADALELMRGVFSNQVALGAAVVALQRLAIESDNDLHALGSSVAENAALHLEGINQQLEKQPL